MQALRDRLPKLRQVVAIGDASDSFAAFIAGMPDTPPDVPPDVPPGTPSDVPPDVPADDQQEVDP